MLLFEKLSDNIGSSIANTLKLDKERQAVITYGAYLFLDVALALFMVILLGALCNVFFEALIFSFTTAILRKNSGGAHSTTSFRCATIGAVVAVIFALIVKILNNWLQTPQIFIYMLFTFFVSYIIMFKLAPKDSPSKPIVKEEKIRALKIRSIWTLHFYVLICLGLLALNLIIKPHLYMYIALICSGTLWQSFTLTSLGHSTIYWMEAPFRYIRYIGGERQ